MKRFFPHVLLCALILSSALLFACGGDENETAPDGDGEHDDASGDGDREAADEDDETDGESEACREGECPFGRYCDENDGLCKTCTEDLHCGEPDPSSGITPVCLNGICERLICGFPHEIPKPSAGVDLPLTPLRPTFDSRRILHVNGEAIFPIGVQGVAKEQFPDVRDNGFNLVIASIDCCSQSGEEDAQKEFLQSAKIVGSTSLFAAVAPVWPPEQIEENPVALTNSIAERANSLSLLFWMGSDRAKAAGYQNRVKSLADFVRFADATKPFAVAEVAEELEPVETDAQVIYIPTFAATNLHPEAEIERILEQGGGRPVWARFKVESAADAENLYFASFAAIAAGATGILFELEPGFADDDETWHSLWAAGQTLRWETDFWLAPRSSQIRLESESSDWAMISVLYNEKIVMAQLAKLSGGPGEITLKIAPESVPFCFYGLGTGERMDLTRESVRVFQTDFSPVIHMFQMAEPGIVGDENER